MKLLEQHTLMEDIFMNKFGFHKLDNIYGGEKKLEMNNMMMDFFIMNGIIKLKLINGKDHQHNMNIIVMNHLNTNIIGM